MLIEIPLANATVMLQVDSNGMLTGATGVQVNGALHDVQKNVKTFVSAGVTANAILEVDDYFDTASAFSHYAMSSVDYVTCAIFRPPFPSRAHCRLSPLACSLPHPCAVAASSPRSKPSVTRASPQTPSPPALDVGEQDTGQPIRAAFFLTCCS